MDTDNRSLRGSPNVAIDTVVTTIISDNKRENKNSKFLSIDDILVRNTFDYRTNMNVNRIKDRTPVLESTRQEDGASEEIESEKRSSFEPRLSVPLSDVDDASYSQEMPVMQSSISTQSQSAYTSRIDLLNEDTKNTPDMKTCGNTHETGAHSSSVTGEPSTDWWTHPLWKQIYESNTFQESQPSLTKLLLPSYLMMSQHVLGSRMSFHTAPVEPSSERSAVNIVFNVEQGDDSKVTQSIEQIRGQNTHNPESTSDQENMSITKATTQTNSALSHPTPTRPKRRRQRQAYTITQLNTLEEEFKNNRYLSSEKRESMSQTLGLSENQVKAWFQNRRTKHKKQLTQHISQLSTSHQTTQRDDRPLGQNFPDPTSFVFTSAQHPFTSLPMVPPLQLHGLSSFLSRGYPTSTSYLSLLQKMI